MPFAIESKLVIAVASSALFDLAEADRVFRTEGVDAYRRHQHEHENDILKPGCAFPFIRRLLSLNGEREDDQPVEVVLLSRNDADTGLRRAFREPAETGEQIDGFHAARLSASASAMRIQVSAQ